VHTAHYLQQLLFEREKENKPTSIKITKGQDRLTQRKKDQTIALSTARLRKKVILIKLEELMGQHYNPW
jgi:hypothetical protein